ncbi:MULTISPECIES: hypothetical protein [Alicyclobacillus]|uniref:Uncharacterized protein n=2 Tax=Alicyclobacillus TaxID=29330 RepID=C8WYC5_ALIAD|nr:MULTISPECIES: hypothetical protein [Alicyclobacillus]ACV60019.1 hypothetical protein Aaci_3016 [Alicyclobacillus acidocaldarius subsp. acidocaldarius DSM 446]SIT11318.1 hypothetical protein SAMN05421799_11461 [Alicyclobacillus vulcanalis]
MLTDIKLERHAVPYAPVWIPGRERTGNVLVEGGPGTGKTYCLKTMLHQDIQAMVDGQQDCRMIVISPEGSMCDIEDCTSRLQVDWIKIYSRALHVSSPYEKAFFSALRNLLMVSPDDSQSTCDRVLAEYGLLKPFLYCSRQNTKIVSLYTGYQEIDTFIGAAFVHYLACNMSKITMKPTILYVDELHRYAAYAPHAVAKLFECGAEHGISLIAAVQSTEQLNTAESPCLSELVNRNTRFHVKMRTSEDRDTLRLAPNQALWITSTTRHVIEVSPQFRN